MTEPLVRSAVAADLDPITAIYNHYVEGGPVTFDTAPYTPAQREPWFEQFSDEGLYRLFVVEEAGEVRGYAGSFRFRPKPAYETSVETTIYLAPEWTGRGLGPPLYAALFEALEGQDLHRALAGITLPNPGSIRLHERFGFRRTGVFTEVGRKQGQYWDVAWYEKPL